MTTTSAALRIVGVCGSLRAGSKNAQLLRYAASTFPSYVHYQQADIRLDLYNEDNDNAAGRSAAVTAFCRLIQSSDAVLFACPEYNYGMTGVLKNAIDWASRVMPGESVAPLINKPYAVLGGSVSIVGSLRAQLTLRQTMVYLGSPPVIKPEVAARFLEPGMWDDKGELKDEATRRFVSQLAANLVDHAIVCKQRDKTVRDYKDGIQRTAHHAAKGKL